MFLQRTQRLLFYLVLFVLSLFVLLPALFVVFSSHTELQHHLLWNKPANPAWTWFSWSIKVFSWLIILYLVLTWKDAFGGQKLRSVRFCFYLSRGLQNVLDNNRSELRLLERSAGVSLCIILVIQASFYLYYLCQTPLQFDEWYSYYFFSADSFWKTMTFYPVPNNHIFSNLVSGLFMRLPFDPEVLIRLPSLLASLLCTYYFYKLAKNTFNPAIALILVCLLLVVFPFITFSIQARGYSFVNLFVVLAMYASQKLSRDYRIFKYRILFGMSLFLGLYSVPSFLYPAVFISLVLGIYVIQQQRKANILIFCLDGIIVAALTSVFYGLIICFNDPQLLLNPNGGSTKFSIHDADAWQTIAIHLKLTFHYFFGFNALLVVSMILAGGAVYFIVSEKNGKRYLVVLSLVLFLSPLIILPLHQVKPFERTWLYLIFPCFLCLGAVFYKLSSYRMGTFLQSSFFQTIVITACLIVLPNYAIWQKEQNMTDFQLRDLRKSELNRRIPAVKQIGFTYASIEYYMAHQILCYCHVENRNKVMQFSGLDSISNQDLLLVDQSLISKFSKGLRNYDSLGTISEVTIYTRKGMGN